MIEAGYEDSRGEWREVPRETVEAIAELLGPATDDADVRVVTAGEPVDVHGELVLEDGASIAVDGSLPPDVPLGYHRLEGAPFVVVPARCWLPERLRAWGWAVQLYALHSRHSWGMGDLGDLRAFNRWAAAQGAGVVLINPLHASLPTVQQPSPYYAGSRCFRNPVYLRVEGEGFPPGDLIDRDEVWARKRAALEARFDADDPSFRRFCAEGGEPLRKYAAFCVLAEEHGVPWQQWPGDVRHPDGAGVARVPEERLRFHQWLQWLVDEQLAAAGAELPVMQDMAVGCDPAGADCWLWQDAFCFGATVGAPPDRFNAGGQDWGLPPLHPVALRAAAYEPFVRTVRAMFRHAGAVRVDHVMGLFRLWWVPEGRDPSQGAYVRYPAQDLLGILALESVRAGAYVVGEDLGTVDPRMREELTGRGVLSYRLVWFGDEFPEAALAAVTTHDLPTVAGVWAGEDEPRLRQRLYDWAGVEQGMSPGEVVAQTYGRLAEVPSMVVTATLEDVLLVKERPNVPGTTTEWPNWSLPLPKSLEEIQRDPVVAEVARRFGAARPTS
ncbi:MAG TPA: 4-alpha-glucanotransferase [Acidimicrobiales bacterium]|nr:4-alpha-glucanotransferase [Acidimicrobiales bacterium]